jgi:hypothetical protein
MARCVLLTFLGREGGGITGGGLTGVGVVGCGEIGDGWLTGASIYFYSISASPSSTLWLAMYNNAL